MKKILIFISGLLVFVSCDNRKLYIENGLPKPLISFLVGSESIAFDTLKYNTKMGRSQLAYTLKIQGETEAKRVSFKLSGGTADISLDGKLIYDDEISLKNGEYALVVKPKTGSKLILEGTIKDQYDKISTTTLKLYCFDNISPTANFTSTKYGVNSNLEYTIDASASFDPDAKWGGGIKSYTYTINGYSFTTSMNSVKWVFENSGNYSVSVMVTDNNGITNTASKVVSIN